ncbi:hypothetical protein F5Y04DRAFT_253045 [Hypomontagnella monticulosa]|nr:hypothetical protein F5Y04DRAFT_253045 [Hypomontagnella monticulosa]
MVGVQSGPRLRARAEARLQPQVPNSDSSDDGDDEGIPRTSPPKRKCDPSIKALDYRRPRTHRLDDDQLVQPGSPKRQKLGSRGSSQSSAPAFSSILRSVEETTSQSGSRSPNPENGVPAGLVNSVNAALKQKEHGSHTHLALPTLRPGGGSGSPNGNSGQTRSNRGYINVHDRDVTSNSSLDEHPMSLPSDYEEAREPSITLGNDDDVPNSPTGAQSQVDIWAIPSSPPPPRGNRIEVHLPLQRSQPVRSSQVNLTQDSGNHQSISTDNSDIFEPVQPSSENDSEQVTGEDAGNDGPSEEFDELSIDSDGEGLPDVDLSQLSVEGTFAQDVANFRAQHPEGYKGDIILEAPAEDDDVTTYINPSTLRIALHLIGHSAWSGMKRGWHSKPFNVTSSKTEAIQTLLELLAGLERLYLAAPRSPRIAEQNVFLSEHSDLLNYYFSRIESIIENIEQKSQLDGDAETHNEVRDELVSLGIPMLFHLLASAWCLGSDYWRETEFTNSTIELLIRTRVWISRLYRPISKMLARQSRRSLGNAFNPREKEQHTKMVKRQELGGILTDLREVLDVSLDRIDLEERRQELQRQDRELSLKLQEETKARWAREEDEMMRSAKQRQWRSLMSIRGIHTPTSESPIPPPSRGSSAASQTRPPSKGVNSWSMEEKMHLFKKIQESYPSLPDLDGIRWELNRTLEETENRAEDLLGLMLDAVHPEESRAQINARVQEIMQDYRRNKG